MRNRKLLALIAVASLLITKQAGAWNQHEVFSKFVLEQFSPENVQKLNQTIEIPCLKESVEKLQSIRNELNLASTSKFMLTLKPGSKCGPGSRTYVHELLLGEYSNEPDSSNMDAVLIRDSDQKYFGNESSLQLSAFRHSYLGGWKISSPLVTFQFPPWAIGDAGSRAEKIYKFSTQQFKNRDRYWGYRTYAWAMHYLSDLTHPLHVMQNPNLSWIPWKSLFSWTPWNGFEKFHSKRVKINLAYYFAHAKYVEKLLAMPESPLASCVRSPEGIGNVQFKNKNASILEIARSLAKSTVEHSADFGKALEDFFGPELKQVNPMRTDVLTLIDFDEKVRRNSAVPSQSVIENITCKSLANLLLLNKFMIERLLQEDI